VKRLFGTDGIRAMAGEYPLDPPTVRRLGVALAGELETSGNNGNRVVLGRDTRESGPWLGRAVTAGLRSGGADAVDAGVISTPGLAHVLRRQGFAAGVMISASHNPFEDNGLKVFGADGVKLSDEIERRIEERILDGGIPEGDTDAPPAENGALIDDYVAFLEGAVSRAQRFEGLRLVLDCANGSASSIAPLVFRHHGAEVVTIGDRPDGRNINLECGSTHLDKLADAVRSEGADVGLAFDGDADRCLGVDGKGRPIDGDRILYILARQMNRDGRLPGHGVVATIMSNFWLEERLAREGVTLYRARVGDKYVLQMMHERGLVLGGEQSGHIILSEQSTTGDGILTGLVLLDTIYGADPSLAETLDSIEPYPQELINIRVTDKPDMAAHPVIGPVVREVEADLAGHGRVVLRYSGTESLARVMIEGKDPRRVHDHAERLAEVIRQELGA
jgi:phosphoglucosamine mutase